MNSAEESFQISQRVEALESSTAELRAIVTMTAESCRKNSESLGRVLDALEGSMKRDGIVDDIRELQRKAKEQSIRTDSLEKIANSIRSYAMGVIAACIFLPRAVDFLISQLAGK